MHGEWLSAVVAVVVGQFVVGVWAWATGCGPVVGTTVGAALATGMAAAFVVSQWPRDGLLRPPAQDHLVVGCALSLVAVVALLVEGVAAGVLRAGWVILVTVLVLVPFGCCVRYTLILEEAFSAWRFTALDREILPLPPGFRLAWADDCAAGGSSGSARRPRDRSSCSSTTIDKEQIDVPTRESAMGRGRG